MHRIFVYGTLLAGFGNHRLISQQGGQFVGEAVLPGFELFSFGGFPGIRRTDREGSVVHGEVWNVEDIAPLDRLEGHPNFYLRTPVDVVEAPDGYPYHEGAMVWEVETYVPTGQYSYPTIASGSWRKVTGICRPQELETEES